MNADRNAAIEALQARRAARGMGDPLNRLRAANDAETNGPAVAEVAVKGTTFEPGKTYWTRSICDYDSIHEITVASRTAKTIKTTKGKTLRIAEWQAVETVKPFGSYSMAAVISADKVR